MPAANNVVLKQEDLNETLEDAVLTRAEEKMMEDEEITSVESNGAMEDTMLTMAMLNSVSDVGGPRGVGEDDAGDSSGEMKDRLRKRRRSDDDEGAGSVPNPLSNPLMPPKPLPTAKVEAPMPVLSSIVEQVSSSTAGLETIALDSTGDPKRKVCFEEPTSRLRGFSIDLECKFRAPENLRLLIRSLLRSGSLCIRAWGRSHTIRGRGYNTRATI